MSDNKIPSAKLKDVPKLFEAVKNDWNSYCTNCGTKLKPEKMEDWDVWPSLVLATAKCESKAHETPLYSLIGIKYEVSMK